MSGSLSLHCTTDQSGAQFNQEKQLIGWRSRATGSTKLARDTYVPSMPEFEYRLPTVGESVPAGPPVVPQNQVRLPTACISTRRFGAGRPHWAAAERDEANSNGRI